MTTMRKESEVLKQDPSDDMSRDDLEKAREARSKKYGIEVTSSSALTYPEGYPRELSLYGDPVNLKYPVDTMARAANARVRFKQNAESTYTEEGSRKVVHERIVRAEIDKGVLPSYDENDALDALLPKDLIEEMQRLQKAMDDAPAEPEPIHDDGYKTRHKRDDEVTVTKVITSDALPDVRPEAHMTAGFLDAEIDETGSDVVTAVMGQMRTRKSDNAAMSVSLSLSDALNKALEEKAERYNDRYGDEPEEQVSAKTLKTIALRAVADGAKTGAEVNNRVNKFLHLMKSGDPPEPFYNGDNDLLPSTHPRATFAG